MVRGRSPRRRARPSPRSILVGGRLATIPASNLQLPPVDLVRGGGGGLSCRNKMPRLAGGRKPRWGPVPLGRSALLPNVTQANWFPTAILRPPLTGQRRLAARLYPHEASGTIIPWCQFNAVRGTRKMLCTKRPPIRNLIDLSDPRQVRP